MTDKPFVRGFCGEAFLTCHICSAHLGVFEDVHDEDGKAQAEDVGCKAGVEVGMGVFLQAAGMAREERGG